MNWYPEFDTPAQDSITGEWWIRGPLRGRPRGGHALCIEPGQANDQFSWWLFYNQLAEGACVGFAWSRAMSILNRERYASRWVWDQAKQIDEWHETNPGDNEGTSVRAGGQVLITQGHVLWRSEMIHHSHVQRAEYQPDLSRGIHTYRWITSIDDLHAVLGFPKADKLGATPWLNNWGRDYPRRVWVPDELTERLRVEDAEFAVPTDR